MTPEATVVAAEQTPPVADEPVPSGPRDCADLVQLAADGGPDAVLLAWLCPDRPIDAVTARAALLAATTVDEAAALIPRLQRHPALQGIAILIAQTPVDPPATTLPNPASAVVSPLHPSVLAQVQLAHTVVATAGIAPAARTRARGLLAKVYLQATQQLGLSIGRPTSALTRLLAGRAMHYGLAFCLAYWRNRVGGLAPLFAEVETRLLELTLTLEAQPHHGDAARLADTLEQTRRYLLREGPSARIERRLAERIGVAWGPERLQPLPNVIDRLLDLGFVDLAIDRGLAEGRRSGGPGLRAMEQLLRDGLSRAEQREYLARLEARLRRTRARKPGPAEVGSGSTPHAAEQPWTPAETVADDVAAWIERAPAEAGIPRAHALGRALLLVRQRPDALLRVLDRANDDAATPALRDAAPWLSEQLRAHDDGRRAWLRRQVGAHRTEPSTAPADERPPDHVEERARRRRFALDVREADRLPRGAGLGRHSG
ncbi:MAG: hypothetical protein K0V04_20930 [Deltaproteobacteria bacterium]|nr:hypothetical protein [Deltaproteobacteria bacterium]